MEKLKYPTIDEVIKANKRVIEIHRVTKAEKHELIKSRAIIQEAIDESKNKEGDIYIKASVLMKELNLSHPFGSGNKRTAYLVANHFLWKNRRFAVLKKKTEANLDMMKKIRRREVTEEDIARWLKN